MDRGKRVAVIGALWVAVGGEPAAGPVELETVTVTETKTIEAEQPQSLNDILKALPNIERRTYTIGYRYDDPKNPWARIEATAYRLSIKILSVSKTPICSSR